MSNEQLVIEPKELIKRLLIGWKQLLVCIVIGVVLLELAGAGVAYRKFQEKQPVQEEKLVNYQANLTEEEKKQTLHLFQNYEIYRKQYEEKLSYSENSILMKLEAENAVTVELNYYIDNHYEAVYPVIEQTNNATDIIAAYISMLDSEQIINEVKNKIGLSDIDSMYIKELINPENIQETQTMKITVYSDSETNANMIADVLNEKIQVYGDELKDKFGDFDIINLERTQYSGLNDTINEKQQQKIQAVNNLKTQMNNMSASLSDDQKQYYDALISNSEKEKTPFTYSYFNMKYIVFGIVFGICLGFGLVFMSYIKQKQLRNTKDMQILYDNYTFGIVSQKNKEKIPEIGVQINACAIQNQMENVAIAMPQAVDLADEILNEIKNCADDSLHVISADNMKDISIILSTMKQKDGIILLVQKNVSLYKDIDQIVILAEMCNLPIMGNIVVE